MAAAFLINFLFWSGVAIGGIAFAALVDATGGQWLGPMRLTAERFTRFLPFSFALFVLLMWRSGEVYPWGRTHVDGAWFQPAFVAFRDAVALATVYVCAFAYCRTSRQSSDDVRRARGGGMAATFLVVYVIGFSLLAVDLVMSLEPRWSSTLFPVYVCTGNVYSGTATVAALSTWTSRGAFEGAATTRARSMANTLVGMALFWTYLFWSQFLVIWYGNLTSEVGYMMARINVSRASGWIVLATCCAAPSIVFVPRWGKHLAALRVVTPLILVGLWIERWLLVAPDLPRPTWIAVIAVTLAFAAGFFLCVHTTAIRSDVGRRPTVRRAF